MNAGSIQERAAVEWLVGQCALEEAAAAQVIAWIRRGVAALGGVPDQRNLIVERFFDGLGGTQIVIHSPFGIRFNRGLGLAIRKRLCQSFDFEIQASAIDDAVLLALNSRHSFPLEDIMTTVNSRTARPTLVQAMLDAPMFEVRFRHVATRALAIMRSMRGRRVPAWIQRLRTQELITAIFPRRNACFENRPPAIEIPDHYIVGETVRECLEESADADRMEAVLRGLEDGSIRVRFVDSVAPSVFAHRILLAWDYSFLDDGERANRRSRTVTMNRAMAEDVFRDEDLSAMISTEAVERVAADLAGYSDGARPRSADELHELVRAHGTMRVATLERLSGGEASALALGLEQAGRLMRVQVASEAPESVIVAEDAALFAAAYPDAVFLSSQSGVGIPASPADVQISQADARTEILRRALATTVPTTVLDLAARLALMPNEIEGILAALEANGVVFRGYFTAARPTGDAGSERPALITNGAASKSRESTEQWCDRYVLERIHRQTLNRLRSEVEPCTDAEFAAFRLHWMQVGTDLPAGPEAVREVLEQLSGLAFNPAFWEQAILPARIRGYRPEHLDLLCLSGDLRWVASAPEAADGSAPLDFPGAITFVPRRRLMPADASVTIDERAAAVHRCLVANGAQYLDQVADHSGLSERDTLAALWRLAAAGLASNDSFAPLRLLSTDPAAPRAITDAPRAANGSTASIKHDAALRARLKSSLSGRWSAIETTAARDEHASRAHDGAAVRSNGATGDAAGQAYTGRAAADRSNGTTGDATAFDTVREAALVLLARHGILAREMLATEPSPLTWQTLSFALRRMEYAGTIRRGYFVRALSGEQYALPEALEMLRAIRVQNASSETPVALSATDPANPYGVLLPGCGVTRESGNLVVLRGGHFVLGLASRALVGGDSLDDDTFVTALTAMMALRPKLTIETIGGTPALDSDRVAVMAAMRFHSDGRALVFDGLPGPTPARAGIQRASLNH